MAAMSSVSVTALSTDGLFMSSTWAGYCQIGCWQLIAKSGVQAGNGDSSIGAVDTFLTDTLKVQECFLRG